VVQLCFFFSPQEVKCCEFIISVCGGVGGHFRGEKLVIMVSGEREGHVAKWVVKEL